MKWTIKLVTSQYINAICRIYRNFFKRQAKIWNSPSPKRKTLCSRYNEEVDLLFKDQALQERDLKRADVFQVEDRNIGIVQVILRTTRVHTVHKQTWRALTSSCEEQVSQGQGSRHCAGGSTQREDTFTTKYFFLNRKKPIAKYLFSYS